MNRLYSTRRILSTIVFLGIIAIGYAFYEEFILHIEPCPLCIVERIVILFITIISIILYFILSCPMIIRIGSGLIAALSIFNIKIAAHHLWLINLPPNLQPMTCGMPLNILYHKIPLHSFLYTILQGDAECIMVHWNIWGINAVLLVLLLSIIFMLLSGIIIFRKNLR